VTPTDGSVTGDKLASTVTTSSNISLDGGTFVFNESGADKDFRIESDDNANMFFVDAGNNKIGINTTGSSPSQVTIEDVTGNGGGTLGLTVSTSGTSDNLGRLHFGNATDGSLAAVFGIADGASDAGALTFRTEATGASLEEAMRISSAGRVGIATTDPTQALEINVDNTTAIVTNALIGSTNTDAANGLGIHNSNNSGVYSGIALETRTSGAARIALLNQYVSTYIGDLDFQFRNGASQNQNHVKFRASGEGEFYFGTELATDGTSPVNPVSSNTGGAEGFAVFAGSYMVGAISANPVMYFNRMTDDGNVIIIRGQGTNEGAISVSGSTVSFDAFTGSHWSRLEDNSKPTILKGTIMDSLDKMMDWYQVRFIDQNNQDKVWAITLPEGGKVGDDYQIADPHVEDIKYEEVDIFYTDEDTDIPEDKKIGDRKPNMEGKSVGDVKIARPVYTGKIIKEGDVKHVYSKVSDTVESKKVYGLFFDWDDDDTGDDGDVNDFRVAQVGTYIIRVNKDVTVEAGDLLVSNGDGTAKKQDDDIIRSKTVARVNSNVKIETYSDGSYTVPCTLHC
jgi:hypothetical protein